MSQPAAAADTGAVERVLAAIADKRGGRRLSASCIQAIVNDYVAGRIADYQMSAWLATVACRGLDRAETIALTLAYVDSGARLTLSRPGRPVVDKHSTGGVGDKVSMFVVPAVAACGVAVGKLSGRGLSFMGGTVDKLESIRGLRLNLTAEAIVAILAQTNMVMAAQSDELVPGDRATYALRDVTATVDSVPLIAASVMSKKIATGARGVVLDVKFGEGALAATEDEARRLAATMIDIGEACGLDCRAVISDMRQPLGCAVGNALEVKEALAALRGAAVPGYQELCHTIATLMLQMGKSHLSRAQAAREINQAVKSGAAFAQFRRWAQAQGADCDQIDDPELLPMAKHRALVRATTSGWITRVGARAIGTAAARLGAGRSRHDQPVDHAVGLVLQCRQGDRVKVGDPLVEMHWNSADPAAVTELLQEAFTIGPEQPQPEPVVCAILGQE